MKLTEPTGNQFEIWKRFCARMIPGGIFFRARHANFFHAPWEIFDLTLFHPLCLLISLTFYKCLFAIKFFCMFSDIICIFWYWLYLFAYSFIVCIRFYIVFVWFETVLFFLNRIVYYEWFRLIFNMFLLFVEY